MHDIIRQRQETVLLPLCIPVRYNPAFDLIFLIKHVKINAQSNLTAIRRKTKWI